jgi:hypothetical protein
MRGEASICASVSKLAFSKPEESLMMEKNPLAWMMQANGLIVDARHI